MDFRKSEFVKEFEHEDKDKILTYIESLYSEKSELNHIIDLASRKKAAIERAGITREYLIDQLIELTDEKINKLIFHYLSGHNSNKFTQLCADQQLLWDMQFEIMKPINEVDTDERLKKIEYKDKVSVRSNELLKRINNLYSEIYRNDEEIAVAVRTIHDMVTYEQRLKKYRNVPAN